MRTKAKDYKPRPGEKDGFKLRQRVQTETYQKAAYVPFFNVIFNDEKLTYIKNYEVILTDYLEVKNEGEEPLLYYEHAGLYQDIYFRTERGEAFSEMELAKRRGINYRTIQSMIDRLEDCELVKRVRLSTSKHFPIILLLCTPYQKGEFVVDSRGEYVRGDDGKYQYQPGEIDEQHAHLLKRITDRTTANLRKEHGKNFPLLKFDKRTIQRAIEGKQERFHLETMKRIVKFFIWQQESTGETWTHQEFMKRLEEECQKQKMKFSSRIFMCAVSLLHLEKETDAGNRLLEEF